MFVVVVVVVDVSTRIARRVNDADHSYYLKEMPAFIS